MRSTVDAALLALSILGGAAVIGDAPAAHGQATSPLRELTRGAFTKPNVGPPSGATTFTPVGGGNLFTAQMVAKARQDTQKQAVELYAGQVTQMVEKAYADYGYESNDVGVAFGGFLETCWEISNGSFKTGTGDAQDQEKTRVVVRQMQNALLASPAYKTMPDKSKQLLYESCTFMMGHLVMQWQQAGSDSAKKATVQQTARQQLQTLFGVEAGSLKRKADGAFVSTSSGSGGSVSRGEAVAAKGGGEKVTQGAVATATKGPLPAASAHGARIFVKYTFQATTTSFDQLILFPSGAAFTDVPSKPVSQFDEATFRATLKPYDVGTWKQSGNTIVLTFPNKKRETVTTLRKVPRGWYDGDGEIDPDNAYNTYFPVIPLTPAQIAGAWKTKSLTTMGFAGGGAPMVAHGSSGDRVFSTNGTFTGGSKSFASATTANMGDAFKSGGDGGAYSTKDKKGAGRWRLDGPLITMETDGKRSVALAYVLPHWKKAGPPDILIDGDWWQRPDKD